MSAEDTTTSPTASTTRSFDAWLKGQWRSEIIDVPTQVIILGKDEDSGVMQQYKEEFDQRTQCNSIYTTYSEFTLIESMEEKTEYTLRICVMSEPGNSIDEMEAAYRSARSFGMPVILQCLESDVKIIKFLNASSNPEYDVRLFDESDISQKAAAMKSVRYVFHDVFETIDILRCMTGRSAAAKFLKSCVSDQCGGWTRKDPFSDPPFNVSEDDCIHMMFYDTNHILLVRLNHMNVDFYQIELTDNEIVSYSEVADCHEVMMQLRYRTKNGNEFFVSTCDDYYIYSPRMCLMPFTLAQLRSVFDECAGDSSIGLKCISSIQESWNDYDLYPTFDPDYDGDTVQVVILT